MAGEKIHNLALAQWLGSMGSTLKVALLNGYTDDPDHDYMDSLSAYEISTTGYTAGFGSSDQPTLSSPTYAADDTNDWATMDHADSVISNVGVPAGVAIDAIAIYQPGSSYADSPVIRVFPCVQTLNGGDLTLTWDSVGIFKLTG